MDFGVKIIPIVEKAGDREILFWVLWDQMDAIWTDGHADRTPENLNRLREYDARTWVDQTRALAEEIDSDNLRYRALMTEATWVGHFFDNRQEQMELFKKAMI